jgi:hypothetical protein
MRLQKKQGSLSAKWMMNGHHYSYYCKAEEEEEDA